MDKEKNRELVYKYPWLLPTDYDGKPIKDYDYSYTELDGWPSGWVDTFGEQFCEDLDRELKRANIRDYKVLQVKEKYGSIRWYDNGFNEAISDLIDRYEAISAHCCTNCGKYPVNILDDGWIRPMCFNCYRKLYCEDLNEEEAVKQYNNYVTNRAVRVKPFTVYSRFDKDGYKDVILDLTDILNRLHSAHPDKVAKPYKLEFRK